MKSRIVTSILVTVILLVLLVSESAHFTFNFIPIALGEPAPGRKDFWQVVNMTNTNAFPTSIDVNLTVNSRKGVYVACSNNVTDYFTNSTNFPVYPTYWDWLNGTSTQMYHWGQMFWYVSNGSLTPISYSDIQFWGPMYFDSGGGVNYTTFMGNTFMADWNLTANYNQPDIVYQANWQGNQIKMIPSLMVPANSTVSIVFDIVMTEPGSYSFNVTTTLGVNVSPSTWTVGGASTILVPIDYATIHDAVGNASAGDTIMVSDGPYYESQIVIDKPLKVNGTGASSTIIDGGDASLSQMGLVRIICDTGNVSFSGFTLRNAGGPLKGSFKVRVGIYAEANATGPIYTITNNTIYGTNIDTEEEDYGLYSNSGQETLIFRYNSITQTGANAILLEQHPGATDVSYNTLDEGAYGSTVYFSMSYGNVNVTTSQTVSYNTINMGTGINFDASYLSGAVTFNSASHYGTGNATYTNVRIIGNTIGNLTTNRRGISLVNDATGDGSGGDVSSPVISGNNITGATSASNRIGIQLVGLVTNASISNNTVVNTDASFNGTVGRYGTHYPVGTSITLNNFANNSLGLIWQGSTIMYARYNWWGNATGPHYALSQYPSSPGDSVSDNVSFEPWLVTPYPPLTPICVVYLSPQNTSLLAPVLGTLFTLNVTVANVTMMYGFQLTLRWNSSLLNLTNPSSAMRFPNVWPVGNRFSQYNYSQTGGYYTLLESATLPAPPFNGTTAVASLVFRSMYDPVYPSNVSCNLTFDNVIISNTTSNPMLRLVYNGTYSDNSVRPRLLFTADEYNATKVPTEFDAFINVTNVVNLYAVDFISTFDPALLNVIYLNVSTLGPIYNGTVDNIAGNFHVAITGISPAINGTVTLAKIRFKVQQGFIWNTVTPIVNSSLNFTLHQLNTSSGVIDHDAINGTYVYRPVQGDMDLNAKVDIVDLMMVAGRFGTSVGDPLYDINADLNRDGTIDILDIILVAHNFG